jgi:hypothetical protein
MKSVQFAFAKNYEKKIMQRPTKKTISPKKARHSSKVAKSIIKALKEVKSRKKAQNYPSKDFDTLMDEL